MIKKANSCSATVTLLLSIVLSPGCASSNTQSEFVATSSDTPILHGESNPVLMIAANKAIQAINAAAKGNIDLLAGITSEEGLKVFPPFACEPNLLAQSDMSSTALKKSFVIANCHEDDVAKRPRQTWGEFFASIDESMALLKTERVVLNQRHGAGFNTGSSVEAETLFPEETHYLAVFLYLDSNQNNSTDWDEVGFVFDNKREPFELVAIYHDFYSKY